MPAASPVQQGGEGVSDDIDETVQPGGEPQAGGKAPGVEAPAGDTVSDDEQFLASYDDELFTSDGRGGEDPLGLFSQQDGVVRVGVGNFVDARGKPRSRRALRTDPPVLTVTASGGESISFALTEQLSIYLADQLTRVRRAYAGMSDPHAPKRGVFRWVREHRVWSVVILVVVGVVVVWLAVK